MEQASVCTKRGTSVTARMTSLPMGFLLGLLIASITACNGNSATKASKPIGQINPKLQNQLEKIRSGFKGKLGVLVSDPDEGHLAGFGYDQKWYLASTVKVLVASEVLRQIDEGKLSYATRITLKPEHFRDGAGKTNFMKPGSTLSIRYLLEEMLTESDNAATDLLIDVVGIEQIQNTLTSFIPNGFGQLTPLLDVRRHAFGELHPAAFKLSAQDFMKVKKAKSSQEKLKVFSKLTGVPTSKFKYKTLREAFESYYDKGYNSATLVAFTEVLTRLANNEWISPFVSSELFKLMSKCGTGRDRIVAGLPKNYQFAHKTGTQMGRVCDIGIISTANNKKITVAVCAEDFKSDKEVARVLARVGATIASVY
jgi:beta-lactamase class A